MTSESLVAVPANHGRSERSRGRERGESRQSAVRWKGECAECRHRAQARVGQAPAALERSQFRNRLMPVRDDERVTTTHSLQVAAQPGLQFSCADQRDRAFHVVIMTTSWCASSLALQPPWVINEGLVQRRGAASDRRPGPGLVVARTDGESGRTVRPTDGIETPTVTGARARYERSD